MKHVKIIGGGPAGSVAATHLARAGMSVTLYEKSSFPRSKLCGGFISAEVIPELEQLGVRGTLERVGVQTVRRVVISASSGREADLRMPCSGWSIARRVLDSVLLDAAHASGVHVVHGDGFAATEPVDIVIDATGRKASAGDGPRDPCGIQAYFEGVDGLTDQVEIHLVSGGYIGLVRQGDGRANVCALLQSDRLREYGPSLDDVLSRFLNTQRSLARRLREAHRATPWLAVAPTPLGFRRLYEDQTYYVGDAACLVDPYAGEGMTFAILGARLLSDAVIADNPASYVRTWHMTFDRPLQMQRYLRWAGQQPLFQEIFVHGLQLFPTAMEWFATRTRAPILAS